jgi:hypothetical protein
LISQQLSEKSLNLEVLQNRFEKQKHALEEKSQQIEGFKESVALKMSVADDLQGILK